ncbi:MAG: hypothetical protein BGO39_02580 [Chloroflexi bacterium 54-19]|nr:MAG: hypothetical protein BGO39_02580 [Chloroflexi bacterium 54-19]
MFEHNGILLDTVSVMNLYASDYIEEIVRAIPCEIAVSLDVKDEADYIFVGPAQNVTSRKKAVDLDPLHQSNVLTLIDYYTEEEATNIVNLAFEGMDNGEAVTCALALSRDWSIATDDRAAIRALTRLALPIKVVSTFDLIDWWVQFNYPDRNLVIEVLRNIWIRRRHKPESSHPLFPIYSQVLSINKTSDKK